jgi:O-acetyl-ADP-ribose deacetylase (regulator of RNase III)
MPEALPPRPERRPDTRWTNPSVRALAGDHDPVAVVTARAREVVLQAMDKGWSGPPFDPIALAELLGLEVAANSEIRDARTVPAGRGKARVEFNPNRPRGRMRYSVAHEIGHTLFPDVAERVRNRAQHGELQGDEWQLEALCNIAAAEFLMPLGSLTPPEPDGLTIHALLDIQRRFDVSTEALAIRLAQTSSAPVAAFCASPRDIGRTTEYQLDYVIGSRTWTVRLPRRARPPKDSVVRQCTAIGYSARGVETWWAEGEPAQVEAVGIPPYPGGAAPRVVGLLKLVGEHGQARPACIDYVFGSATEPRGDGLRLVVHVVNDKTPNWGGDGFASAVRTAWPAVQDDFCEWTERHRASYQLGAMHISRVDKTISVASVVAQHGYGPSAKPRIRYAALRTGLSAVAHFARERMASIHMPRIGTGQAGGQWGVVQDLITETLCDAGLHVTVYDLPGTIPRVEPQLSLGFTRTGQA